MLFILTFWRLICFGELLRNLYFDINHQISWIKSWLNCNLLAQHCLEVIRSSRRTCWMHIEKVVKRIFSCPSACWKFFKCTWRLRTYVFYWSSSQDYKKYFRKVQWLGLEVTEASKTTTTLVRQAIFSCSTRLETMNV